MSSGELANIAIGVVVVVLLVARQLQARPVRETSGLRIAGILGVIGVIEIVDASRGHNLSATTVAWVFASLVVGGGLGAVRAMTVKIRRSQDGIAWRKGTMATGVLWVVSLAAHLALEVGINDSTKIEGFGASTLLLYLAVTLGTQREVVRWRAQALGSGWV